MQFDHIGLITTEKKANETYVAATKVWVTDFQSHPFHVEWLRFEPDSPVTGPARERPHVAYRVDSIQTAARGLKVNMGALRIKSDLPLAEQIKDTRQQIDNGKTMGVEFLLTFGANNAEQFENYYKLMQDAAAYSQERGLKVVLKPHGGASGAAEEIMRCLDQVKHPNFKVWFDAANVLFYTGKDPLEQLKPIASQVTGFCAKDCDKQKGSVWFEFGTGKVDFRAVFTELKRAGFNGPVMVECCALGDTPEAVTANARKNREYLANLFATL